MLNVDSTRLDFPVLRQKVNGKPLVYLDSAATSQRPKQVTDAVSRFYCSYNANVHRGLYGIAEEATLRYEEARGKARLFINAPESQEIVFTKNTTEAMNAIMRGWGEKFVKKGDKVVTTILEHHSNFVPWQQLAKRTGAKFEVVGMDDEGMIDEAGLEKALKGAKLFAFAAASNVTGTLNDTRKLCRLAQENGAVSVVDGAQSVPSMPTDVKRMGCDFLAFSGHKMLAPFGVGVLYGRTELLESMDPFMYGSEMIRSVTLAKSGWNELPYKFEAGTPDVGAVIGLGTAINYLNRVGMENILAHERSLVKCLLDELQAVDGIGIIGPASAKNHAPLVSFTLKGVHPHDVSAMLAEDGICVRSGHHCAMPLHGRLGIPASTRASVYLYNKKQEISRLVESLAKVRKAFA